jgi:hypothetical protein
MAGAHAILALALCQSQGFSSWHSALKKEFQVSSASRFATI